MITGDDNFDDAIDFHFHTFWPSVPEIFRIPKSMPVAMLTARWLKWQSKYSTIFNKLMVEVHFYATLLSVSVFSAKG